MQINRQLDKSKCEQVYLGVACVLCAVQNEPELGAFLCSGIRVNYILNLLILKHK
jgi:hypothetical protein